MHKETLHQNLHQFQAEENTRNAASDEAFRRIEAQNDPLEGGKILFKEGAASTPMKEFAFPWPNETKGYELFPKYLEDDPLVLFHGTAKKKLESILKDGFKAFPPLSSVSYAKSSVYCLTHLCPNGASQEDDVVIAVRFETLNGTCQRL